jgi:hypothetical protein
MKKIYNSPEVLITLVSVTKVIAASPLGKDVFDSSASTEWATLTNDRNEYEGEDHNGWSDGLW